MKGSDGDNRSLTPVELPEVLPSPQKQSLSLRQKIRNVVWDSLDRSPEERKLIAKIDFFILTWAGFTYFSKNLNTNNVCEF